MGVVVVVLVLLLLGQPQLGVAKRASVLVSSTPNPLITAAACLRVPIITSQQFQAWLRLGV